MLTIKVLPTFVPNLWEEKKCADLYPTVVPNLCQKAKCADCTVTVLTPHCCAQFETRNRNCAGSNPPVFPICGKKPKRADYTHHGCAEYNDVNYYPQSDGYQGKKQPLGLRHFVRQWWWWWGRPVSALCLPRNLSSTPLRALYRLSANISPCVHSKKIFCTSMLM